jgi:hypothetical protein
MSEENGKELDLEIDDENQEESEAQPYALVIKVQSWVTPIIGVVMLALGLLGGYFLRPLVTPASADTALSEVSQAAGQVDVQSQPAAPPAGDTAASDDAQRQELMTFLIEETRHFKGDPNASVVMIEFSDFK